MPNSPINDLIIQNGGVAQTGLIYGNGTAPAGAATVSNLSDALDQFGADQGSILYRGATGWIALAPGTAGQSLVSGGAGANVAWGSGGGSGDVVGPASSVDNRLVTFNGITGKLIKDASGLTVLAGAIASSGLISLTAGGSNQSVTITPSGTGEIIFSSPSGDVYARFASGSGSHQGLFTFYNGASAIWSFGKQIDDTFILFSNAASVYSQIISTAGAMRWPTYGVGLIVSDSSGNLTSTVNPTVTSLTTNTLASIGALAINAGGSNQDITATPSGTGSVFFPSTIYVGSASAFTDQFGNKFPLMVKSAVLIKDSTGSLDPAFNLENSGTDFASVGVRRPSLGGSFFLTANGDINFEKWGTSTAALKMKTGLGGSGAVLINSAVDDGVNIFQVTGSTKFTGVVATTVSIATGVPAGSTSQPWKLGNVETGAVTPDATRSVFIDIAGAVYKLIVAT